MADPFTAVGDDTVLYRYVLAGGRCSTLGWADCYDDRKHLHWSGCFCAKVCFLQVPGSLFVVIFLSGFLVAILEPPREDGGVVELFIWVYGQRQYPPVP